MDQTLAQILNELIRLLNENAQFRAEIERLRQAPPNGVPKAVPWVDPLETTVTGVSP